MPVRRGDARASTRSLTLAASILAELGCALGTRIARDNHHEVLIIAEPDDFHRELAEDILSPFLWQDFSCKPNGGRIVTLPADSSTENLDVLTVPLGGEPEDGKHQKMKL